MVVLGFDTSTAWAAVALVGDGEQLFEELVPPGQGGRPDHATALLPAIEAAVETAGGWGAVDRIAVGIGPGSFTGLRLGIASARGLAQSTGKPVAPVGSLRALAEGVLATDGSGDGPVLALGDARRGQVFGGLYSASGVELEPSFVAEPEAAAERSSGATAIGDGALLYRHELEAAGARIPPDSDPVHRVSALHVCRLGGRVATVSGDGLSPIYIRPPDAELWRERDRR
jgi:tRNA threonylcarbamoyladenosine biosynthesis protein TsaB